ncbi:MAG: M10 family metallopeptidase C-terminal domain-containing protein, partial [Rhizobiaceae bacterium]|nr:M10 family metallopeptidase C-terminal domain-containing protein [Rhizobiaceae bacterium]
MCAFCELGQTGLHDFIRSTEVPPDPPAAMLAAASFPTSAAALRALITQHRDAPFQGNDGKPILNNAQIIAQLHKTPQGFHWPDPELSYSFPDAPWFQDGEAPGFSKLGPTQEVAAHSAINVWDAIIAPDIAFKGATANALINFANTTTAIQYAHGYFPDGTVKAGSIWLNGNANAQNSGREDLITPTIGTWGWTTFIHEAGHALGLSHPGKYDASQGQFTYQGAAEYRQDSQMFTLMSYFKAFNTGADIVAGDGQEYIPQTPMMDDIMAIQDFYGAEATRPGNSTYGFNATSQGSVYDFTANKHPFLCIYDTGGTDTIDVSGWNTPSLIDLSPGTFSDADEMTYNISIARGTIIENATTGGGNDLVSGNSVDNVIRLNGGDDAAVGFLGKDSIFGGSGKDTIAGEDGDDYLDGGTNIDRMIGGNGDDTFIVSNSADIVVEAVGEGAKDTVRT